jgi:NAD(P)-dependent dehydrogenase (short-subunit alcohol dehydrogenase family)
MKVLITGTASGIGRAIATKFFDEGHDVIGLDIQQDTSSPWKHIHADVTKVESLPSIDGINILINNAGVQDEENAIAVNLMGYINVGETYAFQSSIKSVLNITSVAAHMGIELPNYCASMGGRAAYTKNLTLRLAKNGVTVNSISPGGVLTDWNKDITENHKLYDAVLNETLLKKWAQPEEIADLAYFLTVTNKSITGQDIIVDNGEIARYNYICDKETRETFSNSTLKKRKK